jgi:ElaB/YqjD/DUF883 family membrane-anchored ribosome-binding protein
MTAQHSSKQSESAKAQVDTDRLITDFKALIADAEALIGATAHQSGEGIAHIREQAQDSLAQAKANLLEVQDELSAKAKAIAADADAYVHEKPWQSVGIAAGLGLLLGLLISRR